MEQKTLSETTLKNYNNYLKNFTFDYMNPTIIRNIHKINKDIKPSALKQLLCAILWKLKKDNVDIKITERYSKLIKDTNKKTNKQELNHTRKNIKQLDDIIKIMNNTPKSIDKLILALYTLTPPRRLKDYHLMKYGISADKQYNYYDGKTFTFNNYKTARTFKTQILKVPLKLKKILNEYIAYNNIKSDELILNVTPQTIFNKIKKLTGTNIDGLRHSYINNFYKNGLPSSHKIENLAYAMGHDVKTNLRYRTL